MSSSGIYPALSGAVAESQNLDTLANNLANVTTTSFRGQRMGFHEVLSQTQRVRGRAEQRFVRVSAMTNDATPGSLKHTGEAMDVALSGPGMLAVKTPSGERFVRGGSLIRGVDGRLATLDGHELMDTGGAAVSIPATEPMSIGSRGEILVNGEKIAQLKLVEFPTPQALRREGNGLYAMPTQSPAPTPAATTQVIAGSLEQANVSPLRIMTDVITTSRHYETLHRVIETFKEIDTTAARDLATTA